jgi:1-acyl-sn-glycerol-3-phosphate acyltransferase
MQVPCTSAGLLPLRLQAPEEQGRRAAGPSEQGRRTPVAGPSLPAGGPTRRISGASGASGAAAGSVLWMQRPCLRFTAGWGARVRALISAGGAPRVLLGCPLLPERSRMWLERLRIVLFELGMVVYLLYQVSWMFHLRRLRRSGRDAEADALVERLVTGWARRVFERRRCELRVDGGEHLPRGQPFVVFCNHQSKYDIPALLAGLNLAIGFVVKRELFYIPGLSYWMRQIGCLNLDRRDVTGGAEALAGLAGDLRLHGRGFIIFPEGTRTRDPERRVQPFKRGALRLASEQDLPVLPVTIDGTWLLNDVPAMFATRGGGRYVRLHIGPLRRLSGSSAPERAQFVAELYEAIRSTREAIRVHWAGS